MNIGNIGSGIDGSSMMMNLGNIEERNVIDGGMA